jgi:hypothetical protein
MMVTGKAQRRGESVGKTELSTNTYPLATTLVNMSINVIPLLPVVVFVCWAEGFEDTETCSSSSASIVISNATTAAVAFVPNVVVVVFGTPAAGGRR